jgi:hypothetical protein
MRRIGSCHVVVKRSAKISESTERMYIASQYIICLDIGTALRSHRSRNAGMQHARHTGSPELDAPVGCKWLTKAVGIEAALSTALLMRQRLEAVYLY